jgi:hypothetical protein
LSDYIDDSFTAARTRGSCLRQSILSVLFFATLGAFLGLPKCNLDPLLLFKWLGFMVDSQEESFRVGDSKLEKIKKVLSEAVAKPVTTPRKVAELAGKILAITPAVLPAALYSRGFYLALKGKSSWNESFPRLNQSEKRRSSGSRIRYNGRKWWPKAVTIRAAVDASAVGYGGLISVDSSAPLEFAGTFSAEQALQSSTAREVRGYAAALEAAYQNFPEMLKGSAVLLKGDNQGAISALNKLRSPIREINEVLRSVFHLCCNNGFDVVAQWIPQESLEDADALSRLPDPSDWGLSTSEMRKVVNHFGVHPTLDLFASNIHHVAERYVSKSFTPGCLAVDATKLDWQVLAEKGDIVWLFPTYRQVSLSLSLLENSKLEALVCMPIKEGSNEVIQLHSMQEARVSAPYVVPRRVESCIPSERVPLGSLNPALLQLGVVHVSWF